MPDVVGKQFDAAKATLESQYQPVVTKDTQPTDAKPAGTVLRQSITVGDPVAARHERHPHGGGDAAR